MGNTGLACSRWCQATSMMMKDFKDDFAILQIGLEDSIHAMFRLKVVVAPGGTFVTEAKVTIDILDDNDSALSVDHYLKI